MEHFFKGLANTESQISAIPPERYGDRFIKFITGVTKTKEAADREKAEAGNPAAEAVAGISRSSTDRVMEKAEHQAEKTQRRTRKQCSQSPDACRPQSVRRTRRDRNDPPRCRRSR
jgi:1-phosphatidylinositol-4-phosphate 5-kinase